MMPMLDDGGWLLDETIGAVDYAKLAKKPKPPEEDPVKASLEWLDKKPDPKQGKVKE